ncbi:hypothetical protein [Corynebacterium cystitidis]|uniref:hypothetical protein n=1 Tax=Corynebacterium cystitidis TaxID=35757 RepID=UPI000B8A3C32|nr:hypothetical protein [Corynebacterium cystitidis]
MVTSRASPEPGPDRLPESAAVLGDGHAAENEEGCSHRHVQGEEQQGGQQYLVGIQPCLLLGNTEVLGDVVLGHVFDEQTEAGGHKAKVDPDSLLVRPCVNCFWCAYWLTARAKLIATAMRLPQVTTVGSRGGATSLRTARVNMSANSSTHG